MICTHCGNCMPDNALTCDYCHMKLQRRSEHRARDLEFRQGEERVMRVLSVDPPVVMPRNYPRQRSVEPSAPPARRVRGVQKHMVNWAKVFVCAFVVLVVALAGGFAYLKVTDHGQYLLARAGFGGNANTLWRLGQEHALNGELAKAVETFLRADELEPDNYEKLQWLAEAYESMGQMADAEAVYLRMIGIEPENAMAYRSVIRLYQAQNRLPEAALIMRDAFEKTGDVSFRTQRTQTVPDMPESSLEAGRYTQEKTVTLTSSQGYEIYYTFGDGDLPEAGQLYDAPFTLGEGYHKMTAVCVSGDLLSDPLEAIYTIAFPAPDAPKSNLQPGTYETQRSVKLRAQGDDLDVTLYYTIDGTQPTIDSPIYTGEGIKLPRGSCTLRAVAVNKLGKVSNELTQSYKVTGTVIRYYRAADDTVAGVTPLVTTREAFEKAFGAPDGEKAVENSAMKGACTALNYGWGEARFTLLAGKTVLYALDTTSASMKAPRGTHVGDTMTHVIGAFRDIGQVANAKGNRSLYYDEKTGYGRLTNLGDNKHCVEYVNYMESGTVTLRYYVADGTVERIALQIEPD